MDLNRLNPTQYMWIITKTNKPLRGEGCNTPSVTLGVHLGLPLLTYYHMRIDWAKYLKLGIQGPKQVQTILDIMP
jgi:hypothetical protein